jgi:hypothetical protein
VIFKEKKLDKKKKKKKNRKAQPADLRVDLLGVPFIAMPSLGLATRTEAAVCATAKKRKAEAWL